MSDQANLLQLLTSDAFPGIGEATVKRLHERFGAELFDVLDQGNKRALAGVLTRNKVDLILKGWQFTASERAVARWLDQHGVDARIGGAAQKAWGLSAVEKLTANPYRLLLFRDWKTVDGLAEKLGVGAEHPVRLVGAAEAAAYAALDDEGSTWVSQHDLQQAIADLLTPRVDQTELLAFEAIVRAVEAGALISAGEGYQVPGAYFGEREIEAWVRRRPANPGLCGNLQAALQAVETRQNIELTAEQRTAVLNALECRLSAFCGGAGVGKTYVVAMICELAERQGKRPLLLALAAKAVRKLETGTGREAMTLAAALYKLGADDFEGTVVVVDEFSMVDLLGFLGLIRKLPESAHLVLCGDAAQIPSIGPGRLLYSFISSQAMPTQELTVMHRQAADTGVPRKLREVREGRMPELTSFDWSLPYATGLYAVDCEGKDPRAVRRLVARLRCVFEGDVQILSPLARYGLGCHALNAHMHRHITKGDAYTPGTPVVFTHNKKLASGDDVVNGLQGFVRRVLNPRARFGDDLHLEVATDAGVMTVRLSESQCWLEMAYALTVHRSQGSDWETVIAVLPPSRLLERSMVYTALSRCKSRCIVLAPDSAALNEAVSMPPSYVRRSDWLFRQP